MNEFGHRVVLVSILLYQFCCLVNWSLYTEGKKKLKRATGRSRLVGSGFTKQANLALRLVFGAARQTDLRTHPPES